MQTGKACRKQHFQPDAGTMIFKLLISQKRCFNHQPETAETMKRGASRGACESVHKLV
jgi:hypothetical protein